MKSAKKSKVGARQGRPKSEEKRIAILIAASELFLARGLAATSMDAVAKRAGVSKQTVYSHFANKDDLFRACISAKVSSYGFDETELQDNADLKTALSSIARQFLDLLFDTEVVAMFRVVIGESAMHKKIAELFFENGPAKTMQKVGGFMQSKMRCGALREDDPAYVTVLFMNMIAHNYQMQLLMSIKPELDAEAKDQHIRKVVDLFLRLYGK